MTPDDYRRILLLRLTSFGDVVRATGFPAVLKKACPRAEIVVVTAHSFAPLFAVVPGVYRVVADSGAPRLLGVWREARRELDACRTRMCQRGVELLDIVRDEILPILHGDR